ncbi:MAG: sugar ABC transporter substrate-binding protein [Anaerolineaceae bacterium]|nr:sugar ABC transporter substrate-binding protein [Anaerolineaceae bacterium]
MKKIFLSIVLTLLFVSACTPTPAVTPVPEEEGLAVIRVGTGDGGEGLTPHQTIIQNFEDENPDIIVQLEAVAGRDYYARLLTQLSAKAAPDIMQIGDDAVPSFVEKGAFIPLTDYMTANAFDPTIYLPGLLEPGQIDGVQYLLPKDYSPLAVYYNKTIFDEAGIDYPQEGWTWDDMLNIALDLTQDVDSDGKIDIYGIQLPANWTTGFEYWVAAAGGTLISNNGKNFVGYMDSKETIRAVQFYADLYNKYRVAPMPADLNAWGGGNPEFANGKAAMYLFGRWPQAGFLDNPNIDLGVVAPPQDAKRANVLFWGGFGIASTSMRPTASYTFLQYYTGEGGAEVWKDWALPAVKSVADSSGLSTDPIEGVWINELNYLFPRAYTFTNYWNESADPALRKALETVILDQYADVTAVMQAAALEAQSALDALK